MRYIEIMNEARAISPQTIDLAIKGVIKAFRINAFQGNCAAFAIALNRALGGGGTLLAADSGDHYEMVDHIALKFRGRIYDGSGLINRQQFRQYARSEDDTMVNASIFEVDEDDALKYVDHGSMGGTFDIDELSDYIAQTIALSESMPIEDARKALVELVVASKGEEVRPVSMTSVNKASPGFVYARIVFWRSRA